MSVSLDALLAGAAPPGVFGWLGDPGRDLAGAGRAAGWQVRELDTAGIGDAASFYDDLVRRWDLPEWFGRNLDALWDVLGDLAQEPLLVIWRGLGDLAGSDPQLAQVLLELFRDAATQADALAVVVIDPAGAAGPLGVSGLDELL